MENSREAEQLQIKVKEGSRQKKEFYQLGESINKFLQLQYSLFTVKGLRIV